MNKADHRPAEVDNFQRLFEFANLAILTTTRGGNVVMVNPYCEKLFGYSKDELIEKNIDSILPGPSALVHADYRNAVSTNPSYQLSTSGIDLYAQGKDGSRFPVEICLSNCQINDILYIITFIADISVRKRDEEAIKQQLDQLEEYAAESKKLTLHLEQRVEERTMILKETLKQLERSQEELLKAAQFQKAVLDHAGAIIIVTGIDGTIQLFNPTAENSLGYSKEEVIGKITPLIFHHPDEIHERAAALSRLTGRYVSPGFEIFTIEAEEGSLSRDIWTYVRKDGTTFTVNLHVTMLRDSEGRITGFMGVAVNISGLKKAEEELRIALKKEKELSDLKSRFVSTASHEFRTPLSTILSSSVLIGKYTTLDEQDKREKHVERIKENVRNLTGILEDFLSLEQLDEGYLMPRYEEINITDLIHDIVIEFDELKKKGQQIKFNSFNRICFSTDKNFLRNILINLISNAIKFSPEETSIEISCERSETGLSVSVLDHGIGISAEDQRHLFDRFFRGKNAIHIKGTGLGLHIVSKYLELLNGSINFTSTLNEGTTFTISLSQNGER